MRGLAGLLDPQKAKPLHDRLVGDTEHERIVGGLGTSDTLSAAVPERLHTELALCARVALAYEGACGLHVWAREMSVDHASSFAHSRYRAGYHSRYRAIH